ncbi:MAG: TPM domain-containing protein, partial [Flavobacteriales bacterium]|nr:TPM domain-containing protein [Flavobacteriales bacterium]
MTKFLLAMHKIKIIFAALAIFISTSTSAQNYPEQSNPPRLVNDYAKILGEAQKNQLEQKLVAYNNATSTQIAVVIINSLEGNDIGMYATELGQKWGIGQKGKDNGLVILISKSDRKMFIATGYGMEGVLPDALAKRIVENIMKPNFRNGDFFGGIDQATTAIIKLAEGEFTAENIPGRQTRGRKKTSFLPLILILLVMIGMPLMRYKSYKRSHMSNSNLTFLAFLALSSSSRHGG